MDAEIQERLDTVVEDDVRRGFKIKELPANILSALKDAHAQESTIPVFEHVKFLKPTPRKRRLINEAVIARYHADLKNPNLLSNDQLRKLNIERGEWSQDMEKRLTELQDDTSQRMRDLYAEGFDQREAWAAEIVEASDTYIKEIESPEKSESREPLSAEDTAEAKKRFDRWMSWSPELQEIYTTRFAAEQGLERYSVDRDQQWLLDHAPSIPAAEAIQLLDDLRDKLRRYVKLVELRTEMMDLQARHARIFAESVEARREAAEQMARLFYCTEVVEIDAVKGPVSKGSLVKVLDAMWDFPQELIDWLILEAHFFFNNVPDEARDFLEQWGFIPALRQSGPGESSDASPAEPSSKPDSQPAAVTAQSSSVSKASTSSTTAS